MENYSEKSLGFKLKKRICQSEVATIKIISVLLFPEYNEPS